MADDDLDFLDTEDEETPAQDNSAMKQMRAEIERLKKQEKAGHKRDQELEELRRFKAEQETKSRVSDAEKAFEAAGLPPKAAVLFVKEHEGEITAESVKGFAESYLGIEPKTEEAPKEEQGETFTPTVQGLPPNQKAMTALEAMRRFEGDPAGLARAVNSGQVIAEERQNPT